MATKANHIERVVERSEAGQSQVSRNAIRDLRGIGMDMFVAFGGGEHWLRKERDAFDAVLADDVMRQHDDES